MSIALYARIVAIQAQVAAVQTRVMGLDAQNQACQSRGAPPLYSKVHYDYYVRELEHLAEVARAESVSVVT